MDRTILHCDLNSFYASVELLERPELRSAPVAVCGDPESRHGIILAKNEASKKFQVKTAETIWQARRKCPDLVLLPAHHDKYRHWSRVINAIYERYTDLVEPFSIDESDNRVFAKLGSDLKKPDATTVITRENFRDKVWPLPVTDLLFVGRASSQVLGQYGVRTIGDLAAFGREPLTELLGKMGGQLYDYAAGLEHSPVVPARELPPPKSIGNSITFRRNLVGPEDIRTGVALLSDSVAARLRKHAMRCATVQVTIRDPDFRNICRQKRLDIPICTSTELGRAAMELIRESWNMNAPIRLLAITGQNLVPEDQAAEQMDLFLAQTAPRRERREQLERAVDGIHGKFGKGAIVPAAVVGEDIDRPADHAGSIPPGGRKLE